MDKFSGLSEGVPAGLRWSLFFLIAFYLMGASAGLSILLAIIGGFSTSLVVDWWKSKDELLSQATDQSEAKPSAITKPVQDAIARLGLKRPAAKAPSARPDHHLPDLPVRKHRSRISGKRLTRRKR